MAEALPGECLSRIISLASPRDACCSSRVSRGFKEAADSDLVWENFLPSDYREILSDSDFVFAYSSKKDLFRMLSSSPILIHGAKKKFWLDKNTGKKCYMLSARELSIAWSANPQFWCWKPSLHSRFAESVELIVASWLEVKAKIENRSLSRGTNYGAYLVIQIATRAFGLDVAPIEVAVEIGSWKIRGEVRLNSGGGVSERGDGWLEVEIGEFYNCGSENEEILLEFREIEGHHLKAGLVIDGIELRPK